MFNVGDEVVCVDDSEVCGALKVWRCPLVKGRIYTVRALIPSPYVAEVAPGQIIVVNSRSSAVGLAVGVHAYTDDGWRLDAWHPRRFRKVERKRTREELYSLIGIDGMLDQRVGEVV